MNIDTIFTVTEMISAFLMFCLAVCVIGYFIRPRKKKEKKDFTYDYMMLGRLQQDCEYFIKTSPHENHLWAGNIDDQILEMQRLYHKVDEKPDWLLREQILEYKKTMIDIKNQLENEETIDKDKIYTVNGYKIRYNPMWCEWQTSHDEIGSCEEFKLFKHAKEYCEKG